MDKALQRMREFLTLHNISIYGAAPSSLLETEPAGYRPSDLLSDSQSLFCVGVELPGGVLHVGPRAETTYWRTANVIYRYLDAILARCATMLEEEGELAVPVFGCFPYDVKGMGDFWGYVSLVKMAEVSGLGKLGKNGLLINSKAGPRLLLGGIVTTARFPAMTSSGSQETGCPQDCLVCQDACPVKAIERNGKVDRLKCVRHSMRSPLFLHLLKSGDVREADIGMVNQVSGVDDHSMYTCIACVAACPLGDRPAGHQQ
jgi:epoxyqueuosine reductase QueG